MFAVSVRVGYIFPACHGELAKYQTCLIFHRPSTTLYPYRGFDHLETILSACRSHFPSYPILLPFCYEKHAILSVMQIFLKQ